VAAVAAVAAAAVQLKNLYLYSNKIKKIENLAHLTRLERLWLADNEIPRIEGLETLTNLTELNLARNKVERVGDVFKSNPRLTSLNLSDNGVGSFKEVSYLARLPSLTDLSLSDPHWGENPITSLCNYQVRRRRWWWRICWAGRCAAPFASRASLGAARATYAWMGLGERKWALTSRCTARRAGG